MSDFSQFKRGPDMTGWLRAPQAEKFFTQLSESVLTYRMHLIGACAVSSDPRVREALARFQERQDLVEFLANVRKESATDDDE